MKLKAFRLALAISAASLLYGCATVGPWDSQEVIQITDNNARIMAGDIVKVLATEYAPSSTTFAISANAVAKPFGLALEKELRETGYAVAVSTEKKPDQALSLAYVLDELGQPGTFRVGAKIQPSYRIERLYQIDADGQLVRSGGPTVLNGSGRSIIPPTTLNLAAHDSLSNENKTDTEAKWSVQVMARASGDGLERNQARLEQLGYKSYIVNPSPGRMRALRVGPFRSVEQARAVLREMQADRYTDAFLIGPTQGGRQ